MVFYVRTQPNHEKLHTCSEKNRWLDATIFHLSRKKSIMDNSSHLQHRHKNEKKVSND